MDAEGGSDAENNTPKKEDGGENSKIMSSSEGQSKPKRQMKTPFQLETLEKAYASKFIKAFPFFVLQFSVSIFVLLEIFGGL